MSAVPFSPAAARLGRMFERFRQGRHVLETLSDGRKRLWNPDRRAMRAEMRKRGLSGGRQKVRLRKQLRAETRQRQARAR